MTISSRHAEGTLKLVQGRSFKTPTSDDPTRHLFVANCGEAAGVSNAEIVGLFSELLATEVQLPSNRRSLLFASFSTTQDAEKARSILSSPQTQERFRKFTVKYAELPDEEVSIDSNCISELSWECQKKVFQ